MSYWLVSLPLIDGSKDRTWSELCSVAEHDLCTNYRFELPDLRVGTLDSLMALSDDLVKVNVIMEGVVSKIRRQQLEFMSSDTAVNTVDGVPVDSYLTRFAWDEAKYPSRKPLKETVDKITENIQKIEDDLKVKISEYNTTKSALQAIKRKTAGSLAVRDLVDLVKAEDIVETENLTTLFVVVGKFQVQEWENTYASLVPDFVVPRSSKQISEDQDYALMSVTLFKRVIDQFKVEARSHGFQVRDFTFNEANIAASAAEADSLAVEVEDKKAHLEEWCTTAYGEAFGAWIHIAGVRLFVESILRYGLPPSFQAGLLKPAKGKSENKLRSALCNSFGTQSEYWKEDVAAGMGALDNSDSHPYVTFTIATE